MRRILYLVLILLAAKANLQAQFWTGLNGPFGGNINDMVSPSAGVMLVATDNGVYRSTDSGATWTRMALGTDNSFSDLDVDPTSSGNKIYAVNKLNNTSARVYLSSDAGATWTPFTTSANGVTSIVTKVKVDGNGFIYLTDNSNRLLKSSAAGGATFTSPVSIVSSVNDLDIDASNNVYISTNGGGIKVYPGSGSAFNSASIGSITASSTVLSAVVSGSYVFVLASDGPHRAAVPGTTFTSIKTTSLTDGSFSGLLDVDASGNLYLVNNSTAKIWTSTNPTVAITATNPTWTLGIAYPYSFSASASFFQTTSTWYLGFGQAGLHKTTTTGSTWTQSSTGIKSLPATNKVYITPLNNYLFMSWSSGLGYFYSTDNGANWALNASAASNTNRNIIGFITLADNTILGYGNGVIRNTSGEGINWNQQSTQVLTELVTSDKTNLFSYSGTSLLKSTNMGVNWTPTAITGLPGTPNKIQVDASNNIYFRVVNEVYKVLSGGTSAVKLTALTASTVQDLQVVGTGIYVLGNSNTLFISTDGGTSFTANNGPTGINTALWVYDAKNMAVRTTGNSFFLSADGGGTWNNQALLDAQGSVNDITISPETYLYAATSGSVMHKSRQFVLPPPAPTQLSIVGTTYNQVQLVWTDNSVNEEDFIVEVSQADNLHYVVSGSGFGGQTTYQGTINYTVPNLSKNTLYFFRVKAINNVASSAYSNEVSVTTLDQCVPTIPNNRSWTGVAVADPGSTPAAGGPFTSATVNIVAIANSPNNYTISNYDLGVDPSGPMGPANFVESCGKTSFLEQPLTTGNFGNGNGTWNGTTLTLKWQNYVYDNFFQGTTTLTLNPTDPIPVTPSLNVYLYSSTEVLLNWSTSPFATSYEIRRSTVSGGSPAGTYGLLATLSYPATTYIDKTATTGVTYYYIIVAKNATGSSPNSAQAGIAAQNTLFRPVENDIQLNFENQQGVSWGDLDGDGDEDIASPSFTNNAGQTVPPVFYENMGNGKDFTRRDLSVLANANTAVNRNINIFDFNNDGKLDMYISRSASKTADILLINNGSWDFTARLISETVPFNNGFRSTAAADYDNDGFADILVGNNAVLNNGFPDPARNQLLKNVGGMGFSEILSGPLVTDVGNPRTVSWADYDNDGDQDLFMTDVLTLTTLSPIRLYKNNGDGTFTRAVGTIFDTDLFLGARTFSWGDIDNDGDLDLYIGSQRPNQADRLYQNDGNGNFTSLSSSPVAETGSLTFGSTMGDIDNDGDIDIIAINGTSNTTSNDGANSIFLNNGNGTFAAKYAVQELITHPSTFEIGGSMADYDQDGFLDIYPSKGNTSAVDLPNFLYKNTLTASSSRNWIEIKLIGTQSNKAAIGARVTVTTASPARTQIREISTLTGYGGANSLIAHFGLGTATTISNLQVKWPSGIIQSVSNITQINKIITITEDNTPPVVTVLNPANNATGVAYNTKLEITFDEKPFGVGGKLIKLFDVATSAVVEQFDAATGVVTGNTVSFTPTSPLASTKQYSVGVEAGAFTDIYGNAIAALAPANWQFLSLDNTPPVITMAFPNTPINKGFTTPVAYKPTVTDNSGNVSSFVMSYRNVETKAFTDLTLTNVSGQQTFNIPAISEMGINFFFTAKDADNNITRFPAAAGSYFTTHIKYTGTNLPFLDLVTGTGKPTDYQIISVPWDIPNKDIASNFSELSGGNTKFRFLRYHQLPTPGWDEYPGNLTAFARGEGYFVNVTEANKIILTEGDSPDNNRDSLFTLSLKKGWNQIGNPYTTAIHWNDVLAYNNITSGLSQSLLIFSGGYQTAANPGVIEPNKGAFVQADNDVNNLKIPFQDQTSGGRVAQTLLSSNIGEPGWVTELTLRQQDILFKVASVGMAPGASTGKDKFDIAVPPRLGGDFIEMSVPHPEDFMKRFARDVVQTQDEFTWKFAVDASQAGTAELLWDNTLFGDNVKELYLFDDNLQKPVNMREVSTYTFDPKQSTQFKIYFGENLEKKILPSRVQLGSAYPNPASIIVRVGFTLPEQRTDYQVRLEVFDMLGRRVATLTDGNLVPGFYTAEWDVTPQALTNGIYVYRLVAAGEQGQEILSGKIVLRK